jgi:hypothetical protein
MTNIINALMWVLYGAIALSDPLVYIPNAIGFVLALSQIVLIILIPRRGNSSPIPKLDGDSTENMDLSPL